MNGRNVKRKIFGNRLLAFRLAAIRGAALPGCGVGVGTISVAQVSEHARRLAGLHAESYPPDPGSSRPIRGHHAGVAVCGRLDASRHNRTVFPHVQLVIEFLMAATR